MESVANQSTALPATSAAHSLPTFPPLELETRSHVPTDQAAFYCMRAPQTMRMWAALEPKNAIKPIRVNGRLAWPVADIRKLLAGGA